MSSSQCPLVFCVTNRSEPLLSVTADTCLAHRLEHRVLFSPALSATDEWMACWANLWGSSRHCPSCSLIHMHSTHQLVWFLVCAVPQEGKQASLAADFSITQFRHIGRLLMVHGRNSYKRSAALGQFVMHRGLIISTMQVSSLCLHSTTGNGFSEGSAVVMGGDPWVPWLSLHSNESPAWRWGDCDQQRLCLTYSVLSFKAVFSSVFYFASVPLYQGFLMVG